MANSEADNLTNASSNGALIQASGGLKLIDDNLCRITVTGQTFLIDETTVMIGYNDEIITLAELATGQAVSVNGRKGKYSNVYASSIQVLAE